MELVEVKCDRCKQVVPGLVDKHCTGGFYDVSHGTWSKFALAGEKTLCDSCMHSDLHYRQIYGVR